MIHPAAAKRRVAGIGGVCLLVLVLGAFDALAGADVFIVSGVAVDSTAADAQAARAAAMAQGQREAFRRLVSRLTMNADRGRLGRLDSAVITEIVQGMEVADEQRSATRYLARLTIRFKPAAVRRLFRGADIAFAETASRPVLVLPVLRRPAGAILWEDPNPWRLAWAGRSGGGGLVPLAAPLGDLDDISAVRLGRLRDGSWDAVRRIARRYDAGSVLVAIATVNGDPPQTIDITLRRLRPGGERVSVERIAIAPGLTIDAVLGGAVDRIARRMEDDWKRANLLLFDHPDVLRARIIFAGLGEWLRIRNRLDSLAMVRLVELRSLTRFDATVRLHYLGDPQRLAQSVAQRDLDLVVEQGEWVLRLGRGGGATDQGERAEHGP